MLHIVLYQPEIPPNTGNIIRLCANTGVDLHLIHPLGFSLDNRQLRRAGLDYHEFAHIHEHQSIDSFHNTVKSSTVYAASTKGTTAYSDIRFSTDDVIIFGPETRGLPDVLLQDLPQEHILRIPMREHSRSLNLSNAVAVIVYEALRQHDFRFRGD